MMKRTPIKALTVTGCLSALVLLAGCFETKQEFTLNPDGSGKVVHESKFQSLDITGPSGASDSQVKAAAAEIISKAKGVDAWSDVSFERMDDGRISFKGTAYFRNLSDLDIPNQTMLEFDWAGGADGTGELTMRAKKPGRGTKPDAAPETLSAAELAQKLKESRAQYQQMKPMMAMMVGTMKHEVVFHLPGRRGQSSAFQVDAAGSLRLQFEGAKLLEAMEMLINDDAWMALNGNNMKPGGSGPQMDERMSELMFGEKGPVRATVSGLTTATFDYEGEVAAAKENFASLQQQMGPVAVAIAPPAQGGALKSLKVVGVRLVRETDAHLEIQPFGNGAGYTIALLAELPGSVHAISDESGLDSAVANDGTDLLPESEYMRRFSFPKLSADKASVLIEAQMNAPGAGVTGLKELTGHLRYTVAGSTVETDLGFAKLEAGAQGKEFGAEIQSFQAGGSSDQAQMIDLKLELEPGSVKAVYLVVGNTRTELPQRGYGGGGGSYVFTYESETAFPARGRIVTETYAQMETFDTPFRLENITLLGEPAE